MFFKTLPIVAGTLIVVLAENNQIERRLNNGVGVTPAMGWNSWNQGGCNAATASVALNTAKAFISLGLKDLGYLYINIDDCWSKPDRDSRGNLVPDPTKWPNGMKSVADQIHGMGLKMGLYGDAGTKTCAHYPGSQGFETQDANTLASWGIDYWKHDNCDTPNVNTTMYYPKMRDALQKSGRTILYSMCQWGRDSVWIWGATVGNSWRITGDIENGWTSVASIAASSAPIARYAAPGGFNDLDMMQLGNGKLTANEERAHMGLWAIAKSPIIMGTDMTRLSASTLAIIKNKGIISISQDSLGKAATTFRPSGAAAPVSNQLYPYWAGPLSDGVVVGLVAANGAATLSVNFADVPGLGSGTFSWTELYTGRSGSGSSVSFSLGVHDMAVVKVTKGGSSSTRAVTSTSSAIATSVKTTMSTSIATSVKTTMSTGIATPIKTTTVQSGGGTQTHWGQCGGQAWTGPTQCESPYTCKFSSAFYSQCI